MSDLLNSRKTHSEVFMLRYELFTLLEYYISSYKRELVGRLSCSELRKCIDCINRGILLFSSLVPF